MIKSILTRAEAAFAAATPPKSPTTAQAIQRSKKGCALETRTAPVADASVSVAMIYSRFAAIQTIEAPVYKRDVMQRMPLHCEDRHLTYPANRQ
jgi:hypothetical protein